MEFGDEDTSVGRERLTAKGRAMRERIVAAAAELVFKSGARETSLDDVRHHVGAASPNCITISPTRTNCCRP